MNRGLAAESNSTGVASKQGESVSWRRLTGMDAAFLYAETENSPLHVMGALVLESHGRGPREDFRRVRAQIERRLPRCRSCAASWSRFRSGSAIPLER